MTRRNNKKKKFMKEIKADKKQTECMTLIKVAELKWIKTN